jgi:hypothetical protein
VVTGNILGTSVDLAAREQLNIVGYMLAKQLVETVGAFFYQSLLSHRV